jgi:tetratricopeptide (TPR) repeat protein
MESAIRDLTQAIELAPDCANYYGLRAKNLLQLGRFQDAHADFERQISLHPMHPNPLFQDAALYDLEVGLARSKSEAEELSKRAIERYQTFIRMKPNLPEAYVQLSRCQGLKGRRSSNLQDVKDAVETANKGLARWPQNPDLLYYRAAGHFALGNLPASLMDMEEALRLAPVGWGLQSPAEQCRDSLREKLGPSQIDF